MIKIAAWTTASALALSAHPALAQDQRTAGSVAEGEIVVTGTVSSVTLDEEGEASSRLNLSLRETPATVEVLTSDQLELKGLRSGLEAYNAIPGLTAGNGGGDPVLFSVRGFTGGAVTLLQDGVRLLTSTMTARNIDTFSVERIELLKGPASVLYGEGALAGAINVVPKRPVLGIDTVEGLFSFGSFDTLRAGAGFNLALGEKAALRLDGSAGRSDGWVSDTGSTNAQISARLLLQPSDTLSFTANYEHYQDDNDGYFGTPLLPESVARDGSSVVSTTNGLVLDRSIRDNNYGPNDQFLKARSDWFELGAEAKLGGGWSTKLTGIYYNARRFWGYYNSPSYNSSTGLISRGVNRLDQTHDFWMGRATIANDSSFGSMRNRFTLGIEYNDTDLTRPRSVGTLPAVDPFDPDRGFLPPDSAAGFPGTNDRNTDVSSLSTVAIFAEDALNLTPQLLLVGGARYEWIDLDREFHNLNTGTATYFGNEYNPFSWRIGAVYEITPAISLFGQYSSAIAPVATPIIANAANTRYELTKGYTYEGGLKSSFMDGRGTFTASAYKIVQNDIVTIDPNNVNNSIQGGTQSSRGVEASLGLAPFPGLRLDASATYVDAQFDELFELVSGVSTSRAGNRPANVPDQVYTGSIFYDLPNTGLTLGATGRATGRMYANNANTVSVRGYETLDLSASYRIDAVTLTGRVRNVFDSFYVNWTGGNGSQFYIGAPRSYEVSLATRF